MLKKVSICLAMTTLASLIAPVGARAETDMSKFSLCRAAPADAFITVAARGNAERKFLDDYWKGVMDAFWESGVVTDVWDLITQQVPDEQLAEVEEIKEKFTTLCGKVNWGDLFEEEFVYSGRFTTSMPGMLFYEGIVVGRSKDKESTLKSYEGLNALLSELAKLIEAKSGSPVLNVTSESRKDGLTLSKATVVPAPFIEINIGMKNDLIIITFGSPQILTDTLANLSETKEAKRIVETDRFRSAFAKLPEAEDSLVFFDVERMLSAFRGMANMFEKMTSQPPANEAITPEDDADSKKADAPNADAPVSEEAMVAKVVSQILNDVSILEYTAAVEWTDGHRAFTDSRAQLKDGGKSSPIYKIVDGGKPVDDFAKYVPREATSFSVSSGISISALYDYVINMIEKNAPDGKAMIAEWQRVQKEDIKLNLKEDLFDLIEGSSINVSMGDDWVELMRVTDEKKADAQVKRLIAFVKENVPAEQGLTFAPVKVAPEVELLQISHPMMMMMGGMAPVFGVAEGYFVLGSSPAAVKKCLQTARGKHPNIKESDKWKEQALMPDGSVRSISFTNQENLAKELQQALTGLSMVVGFMQMGAANMPPEAQTFIAAASQILSKLAPVAAKMNFYRSSASYTTFDGSAWTTHVVQNYKSPAEVKALNADSADSSM